MGPEVEAEAQFDTKWQCRQRLLQHNVADLGMLLGKIPRAAQCAEAGHHLSCKCSRADATVVLAADDELPTERIGQFIERKRVGQAIECRASDLRPPLVLGP